MFIDIKDLEDAELVLVFSEALSVSQDVRYNHTTPLEDEGPGFPIK